MAKRRKGSRDPLRGSDKPIGPVLGLAISMESVSSPVKVTGRIEPNDDGAGEMVFRRVTLAKGKIGAQLLSVAAGAVNPDRVKRDIVLTPGQRRRVNYLNGEPVFPDNRQVMDPEAWQELEDPRLVVVRGFLSKVVGFAIPHFKFDTLSWDLADPAQHQQGALTVPSDFVLPAI